MSKATSLTRKERQLRAGNSGMFVEPTLDEPTKMTPTQIQAIIDELVWTHGKNVLERADRTEILAKYGLEMADVTMSRLYEAKDRASHRFDAIMEWEGPRTENWEGIATHIIWWTKDGRYQVGSTNNDVPRFVAIAKVKEDNTTFERIISDNHRTLNSAIESIEKYHTQKTGIRVKETNRDVIIAEAEAKGVAERMKSPYADAKATERLKKLAEKKKEEVDLPTSKNTIETEANVAFPGNIFSHLDVARQEAKEKTVAFEALEGKLAVSENSLRTLLYLLGHQDAHEWSVQRMLNKARELTGEEGIPVDVLTEGSLKLYNTIVSSLKEGKELIIMSTVAEVKETKAKKKGRKAKSTGFKVGQVLTRKYNGKECKVTVVENGDGVGFQYEGRTFPSLTATAKDITKYPSISGPKFFEDAEVS